MKRLCLVVAYLFLLQACASYSPYQPANKNGFGYSHSQLSETQYRIDFKARDIEQGKALDYAMLRAAELTIEKGYDWYEVVDKQSDILHKHVSPNAGFNVTQSRSIERNCGLLGCTTRMSEPHSSVTIGAGVGERDRGIVTVLLEIKMGKGVRPDADKVYSASALVTNLRPKLAR